MYSPTLLPYACVTTYDLKKNMQSRCFATVADATQAIERSGSKCFNVYRIDKVNGMWRTDWTTDAAAVGKAVSA